MVMTSPEQTSTPAVMEQDPETALGLVRHLLEEVSLLFRQEVRLATAEVSHRLATLIAGVTSVAAAAAVLFCGLLVLLAAAVLALALAMPAWLAALVVGALCLIVGFVLLGVGRAKFRATNLKPERTVESLAKDKDVLARRTTT
jgi:membrane-bound ClpP family serine protease